MPHPAPRHAWGGRGVATLLGQTFAAAASRRAARHQDAQAQAQGADRARTTQGGGEGGTATQVLATPVQEEEAGAGESLSDGW